MILRAAQIDATGRYRYTLTRIWSEEQAPVLWIMLNPSTADAETDDPTIRRCIGFSRSWGYGGIVVTNLFALRATDPRALHEDPDPLGPENDGVLSREAERAGRAIAAWGAERMASGPSRIRPATAAPCTCPRIPSRSSGPTNTRPSE